MVTNLKALLVVLALALAVFAIAKPICLRFMQEDAFVRRRNVWLALTVIAFISPSFWLYSLVAFMVMLWAGRKDSNPVALYLLLLHVIPPFGAELPAVLINRLFELDNYRILALAVLAPAAWKLIQVKNKTTHSSYTVVDRFMLAYLILQLVLLIPYEDFTNTVRRGVLFSLDSLVLFYVVSRTCASRALLTEAMVTFCLACAILAPLALFESIKGWLLYPGLGDVWALPTEFSYLFRGDSLRAQVSTGHSLALGYLLAMAFGFWLFLCSNLQPKSYRLLGSIVIWIGLIAAYSRAPWLTGILVFFVYTALQPNGALRLIKALLIALPVAGAVLVSPLGPRIIDNLPFVGTVDSANVDYRQQLAEASWVRIKEYPFFGDPFFLTHLESMRQGQGIIDLVNVYASITMLYGIVGLLLFLTPFVIGMIKTWQISRNSSKANVDLSRLGTNLSACMFGTIFFMGTGSFGTGLEKMYYILIGFSAAYVTISHIPQK